jgi:hypothetical protein
MRAEETVLENKKKQISHIEGKKHFFQLSEKE